MGIKFFLSFSIKMLEWPLSFNPIFWCDFIFYTFTEFSFYFGQLGQLRSAHAEILFFTHHAPMVKTVKSLLLKVYREKQIKKMELKKNSKNAVNSLNIKRIQ